MLCGQFTDCRAQNYLWRSGEMLAPTFLHPSHVQFTFHPNIKLFIVKYKIFLSNCKLLKNIGLGTRHSTTTTIIFGQCSAAHTEAS